MQYTLNKNVMLTNTKTSIIDFYILYKMLPSNSLHKKNFSIFVWLSYDQTLHTKMHAKIKQFG